MHTRIAVAGLLLLAAGMTAGCMEPVSRGVARFNDVSFGDTRRAAYEAGTASEGPPPAGKVFDDMTVRMAAGLPDGVSSADAMPAGPLIGPETPAAGERKLIRDAALVVGVANIEAAVKRAQSLAEALGGYVQEADSQQVVLRVPADRFDEATGELAALGQLVDRKVQARDVTEEYLDIELRLKTKRALLERLQGLAAKAEKVEDLLKVEQELARLTLEIEQLEGKLRLLASQVALSRIAVAFTETSQSSGRRETISLPFPWLTTLGIRNLVW